MPAGVPAKGIDRRFLTCALGLRTAGANVSVTYSAARYNPDTGVIAVGGDTASAIAYMGMLSDGIFGDLIQAPALPGFAGRVSPGGIAVNKPTGGWLALGNNDLSLGLADMSVWADITPPAVVSREAILEWRGRIFIGKQLNGPIGSGNLEFSDDNGATWDTVPGINTGMGADVDALYADRNDGVLLAIAPGGANAAFSKTTGAASWTLIPTGNGGTPMNDAAVSDNGRQAVIVSNNGSIDVTGDGFNSFTTIPVVNNPFQSSLASVWPIENVEYVADLGGFVLVSNVGLGRRAFIDERNMTTVFMSSHLGETVSPIIRSGTNDGFNALIVGASNIAVVTLRKIGQPGKT